MPNRKIRLAAWAIILALAVFQAYANRYAVSPDGMSYLDLSDAVVQGKWSGLVNLYWSPLYPFLVGAVRAAAGAGPRGEVAAMHFTNAVCFVGLIAAFDYFLIQVLAIASRVRGAALRGARGTACAYGLFGMTALTMTPLELTTPDLLSNAAIFVALGAMLRLADASWPRRRREAVILGVALGVGVLAKAFLVPWSILCFVVLAIVLRRKGLATLGLAVAVWSVFVAPWTVVLSARAHRLTFGDTGRLTYAWYVNSQDPPSLRVVPAGARAADTDALLPGVGVTGDAPGTDPMWFDPARWNNTIRPHFSLREQYATIVAMAVALAGSVSVLAYIIFMVAVAPAGSRRRAWLEGWVVLVPSVAGVVAYLMVILTARYVMAFILAGILVVLATVPVARRVRPTLLLLGLVLTMATMAVSPATAFGFSFVVAIAGAMFVGTIVPTRRRIAFVILVPLTLIVCLVVMSPSAPALMRLGGAAFVLLLWARSRGAIVRGTTLRFAYGMNMALALSIGLVLAGRLALRLNRDALAFRRADAMSNPEWRITQDLRDHGIEAGTRIAVIGPHAESYWARTARLKIVANVPDPLAPAWWLIPQASRDTLLRKFAERGATVAILTREPPTGPPDTSWVPLRYQGWMKRLR